MAESHHVSILDHFADLDDPRVERTRRHKLVDITGQSRLIRGVLLAGSLHANRR